MQHAADHLALVGVLAEQLERLEAKVLVLSLLELHDSRQQLSSRARVSRHALVHWDVPASRRGLAAREGIAGRLRGGNTNSLAVVLQHALAVGVQGIAGKKKP
jgi:hypothetical protein